MDFAGRVTTPPCGTEDGKNETWPGPKDGGSVYDESDREVQNGNSGLGLSSRGLAAWLARGVPDLGGFEAAGAVELPGGRVVV